MISSNSCEGSVMMVQKFLNVRLRTAGGLHHLLCLNCRRRALLSWKVTVAELVCLGKFEQGSVKHIRFGIRLVHTSVPNTIGCPAMRSLCTRLALIGWPLNPGRQAAQDFIAG